jgi:hypothetical protein
MRWPMARAASIDAGPGLFRPGHRVGRHVRDDIDARDAIAATPGTRMDKGLL